MSEIDDLMVIAGAIDTVAAGVEADDPLRRQVASLVPAYRAADRFGWYGELVEGPWYQEFIERQRGQPERQRRARRDVERLPNLDEEPARVDAVRTALVNLGEPTRFASMLPRRLLAIALMARMFPDQFGPGGEHREAVLDALIVPGIIAGLPPVPTPPPPRPPEVPGRDDRDLRNRARSLLLVLADPAQLERLEDWHEFLTSHAELLSPQLAGLPPPCATRVIEQPTPGRRGPIVLVQTELCLGGVDLERVASGFLDWAHWPQCCVWWCRMLPAPSSKVGWPLERYLEVVADDCTRPLLLDVSVFLDFAKPINQPNRKVVTFNISRDQRTPLDGHGANNAVDVDRGVIEVRQDAGHVHVATSKRVRFTRPDWIKGLPVWACLLGYGEVATDMISNCSGGRRQWIDCDVGTPYADACRRFVELASSCLSDAGEEVRRVSDRLGPGVYSPETAASEAARMTTLAIRGWGKVVTTFAEAMGDLVRPPAQPSSLAPARQVRSFSFDSALSAECSLSLAGPLQSPYGDKIDIGRVTIIPGELGPGGREFRLAVDVSRLEGSAYLGEVVATKKADNEVAGYAAVDVIVP